MPEAADTRDHDPVARLGSRHLQALVHGDARTQDRRDLNEIHVGGQAADVIGIGDHIFGEGAVNRVPGVLLRLAQRFPAGPAVGAVPTGGVQPWNADPVVLAQVCHAGADGRHVPHTLMARDERKGRLHRPIAADRMQIGPTHPAGSDLHKHLAGAWLRDRHTLDCQRFAEVADDCCFHCLFHDSVRPIFMLTSEQVSVPAAHLVLVVATFPRRCF